jgi:hypothetical protein
MPKPERSDSPRPRKKKKGRSDANQWILPVLFVIVALAAGTGAFFLVKTLIFGGSGGTASSTWPLPPGTPVEKLYGTFDEPIDPCTVDTLMHPLRRRSTDPLVVLSNPRIEESKTLKRPVLLVDVKVSGNLGDSSLIGIFAVPPGQQGIGLGAHVTGMNAVGRFTSTTVEVDVPTNTGFGWFGGPVPSSLEIWAVAHDRRYKLKLAASRMSGGTRTEGSVAFKVSPSIFLGPPSTPRHPREWHANELVLLQTTGGETEISLSQFQ